MENISFESICKIEPKLSTIKPIRVDRLTCTIEGFGNTFWNDYSRLKAEIEPIIGHYSKNELVNSSHHYDCCIDYFINKASVKWEKLFSEGYFDEERTEEEEVDSMNLHNYLNSLSDEIRLKNFRNGK